MWKKISEYHWEHPAGMITAQEACKLHGFRWLIFIRNIGYGKPIAMREELEDAKELFERIIR